MHTNQSLIEQVMTVSGLGLMSVSLMTCPQPTCTGHSTCSPKGMAIQGLSAPRRPICALLKPRTLA